MSEQEIQNNFSDVHIDELLYWEPDITGTLIQVEDHSETELGDGEISIKTEEEIVNIRPATDQEIEQADRGEVTET